MSAALTQIPSHSLQCDTADIVSSLLLPCPSGSPLHVHTPPTVVPHNSSLMHDMIVYAGWGLLWSFHAVGPPKGHPQGCVGSSRW